MNKDQKMLGFVNRAKLTVGDGRIATGVGIVHMDILLGETEDKNHVYSIRYENHDYIDMKDEIRETIDKIKKEAENLRDKIKIK